MRYSFLKCFLHGQKIAANKYVLVYDLGGGTFDTTLICISADGVDIVCTDGDHQLGGKDWDDRLVQRLAAKFNEAVRQNIDPADDMEFYYELGQKAEQLKKQLTNKAVAKMNIAYQGNKAAIEIKREEFESMTADLLNRTVELTNSMTSAAKKQGAAKFDSIGQKHDPRTGRRMPPRAGRRKPCPATKKCCDLVVE
jgi:molecular chaperone DnaK (HSP70)